MATFNSQGFKNAPTPTNSPPTMAPPTQHSPMPDQTYHNGPRSDKISDTSPTPILSTPQSAQKASVFSKERYRPLFDVNEKLVFWRILKSILFCGPSFYGEDPTDPKNYPDLYGPFWITTTLVLVMGIVGSVQQNGGSLDIEKVSYAALTFYIGLTLPPFILYWFLRWFRARRSLTNVISLYGYSFFIYIPMAICSIIPIPYIGIVTASVAAGVSTLFIVKNTYCYFLQRQQELYSSYAASHPVETEGVNLDDIDPEAAAAASKVAGAKDAKPSTAYVGQSPNKGAGVILMIGVIAIHLLIAILCYFFFFKDAEKEKSSDDEPTPTPTPTPTPEPTPTPDPTSETTPQALNLLNQLVHSTTGGRAGKSNFHKVFGF